MLHDARMAGLVKLRCGAGHLAERPHGEGFLMRVATERCSLRDHEPRWKTSQGGSRGGLGSGYGESARTVAAAAASGVRLMAMQAPEMIANPADDPDEAVRSGKSAAVCRVGSKRARAVWTGPAVWSRCCSETDDGR